MCAANAPADIKNITKEKLLGQALVRRLVPNGGHHMNYLVSISAAF